MPFLGVPRVEHFLLLAAAVRTNQFNPSQYNILYRDIMDDTRCGLDALFSSHLVLRFSLGFVGAFHRFYTLFPHSENRLFLGAELVTENATQKSPLQKPGEGRVNEL